MPLSSSFSHLLRALGWRSLLHGDAHELTQWLRASQITRLMTCVLCIVVGGGIYGVSVGMWRSPLMGVYVGMKLPILILLTLGCNALLNGLLGLLLGSGLGLQRSLLALLMSFSVFSLLLGALAPVAAFLSWSLPQADSAGSSTAHAGLLLLHTTLIGFAGVVSQWHLLRTLREYCPTPRVAKLTLLSWLAGNGFVGAQFSWVLRPFFGSPELEVAFLRPDPLAGTFYYAVWRSLVELLSHAGPRFYWGLISVLVIILISLVQRRSARAAFTHS